jgi:hypothetical protein
MSEKVKFLVTVKTYPHPSESYLELVCTAGVREDGSFIRLYPVDYRYRPYWEWYEKYQWIEVEVDRNPKDPRPESFCPVPDSEIMLIGEPLKPQKGTWAARKEVVLAKGVQTMCALSNQEQRKRSLGIIQPHAITDFTIEPTERKWPAKWEKLFLQKQLIGPDRKPLEKIPFKFSYHFICDNKNCNGHKMMIEDWEIGVLYLKMRNMFQSEEIAVEKVREKFFDILCAPDVDTHFFVGTVLEHGTWIILGVFWPKKQDQMTFQL